MHQPSQRMQHREAGMSILEIALMAVVTALLVGFLVSGYSYFRASQIIRLGSTVDSFVRSVNSFRMKYHGLPGDTLRATAYYGVANGCPMSTNGPPETCDGNGDGRIGNPANPFLDPESARFWQHLALAEFIDGPFPGRTDVEKAVPDAGFGKAYWGISDLGSMLGNPHYFDGGYMNSFQVGGLLEETKPQPYKAVMNATEAEGVDKKYDDGQPANGRVVVFSEGELSTCTNATATTVLTAAYAPRDPEERACGLVFRNVF